MKLLIPNAFEMSLIRDAINKTIHFDEPECEFTDIWVRLPNRDTLCLVDVVTESFEDSYKNRIEITDAVACDIYNTLHRIDIIGLRI